MLRSLSISNYALINKLNVSFHKNLNTITGETGAGKSIILGALGLILGNRAELAVLKDKSQKCIVEGHFDVSEYSFKFFFEANDLDYDSLTILRREISPAGKSRAFVNDTPVNLKTLRELGLKLIDIHSQHQNLELGNHKFQLDLIDAVAGNNLLLAEYKELFSEYTHLTQKIADTKQKSEKAKANLDYLQFQFNQLEEATLQENEQEKLESELEKLTHAEDIKLAFSETIALLDNEQSSAIQNVKEAYRALEKVKNYFREADGLAKRMESAAIELKDILDEAEQLVDKIEFDPQRIEQVNQRLSVIYTLQQKHNVASIKELIELKTSFDEKINKAVAYDDEIYALNKQFEEQARLLEKKADKLSLARKSSFKIAEKSITNDLKKLGMPNSKLQIVHKQVDHFQATGKDIVAFRFSSNQDTIPTDISKIASGGEMSRLMLAVKNLLRGAKALPTIVFDEIDSGISGEIALKMGNIIKSFSSTTQVINITHLPQVAAKGDAHFQVYKKEENKQTITSIQKLSDEQRVMELAKMLGGEKITDNAMKTALDLLEN